jgi:hypothetical protein
MTAIAKVFAKLVPNNIKPDALKQIREKSALTNPKSNSLFSDRTVQMKKSQMLSKS